MNQRNGFLLSGLVWLVSLFSVACTHTPVLESAQTEIDPSPRSPSNTPASVLEPSGKILTTPKHFTSGIEGPAVDRMGNLYAVNFTQRGNIGIVPNASEAPADGSLQAKVFLTLPKGGIPNSIRFGPDGSMFIADYKNHRVFRLPANKFPIGENNFQDNLPILEEDLIYFFDAEETFKGQNPPPMNQPNDMAIASDGTIYLSDPTWGKDKDGNLKWGNLWRLNVRVGASDDLSQAGIEKILPDFTIPKVNLSTLKANQLASLPADVPLRAPNGIDLSPDGKKLYFGDSQHGNVYVADLVEGEAKNPRIFLRLEHETLDGIRTDMKGNVYVARSKMGQVHRFPPDFKVSTDPKELSQPADADRLILNGKNPSNMAFGGPKGTTLFVTVVDCGCIERIEVSIPGREWYLWPNRKKP